MELLPAVDIRQGGAVRLTQGDFDRQVDYGDPVALARRYVRAGARWVHVVDLDAARLGSAANRPLVLAVVQAAGVPVQVGGGIRRAADAAELLDGGAARVVLGTAAVADPGLVADLARQHPGRIVVGVDHRGGGAEVAVSGWERAGGVTLEALLDQLDPVPLAAVVVTAIERDGMLGGPDVEGLRRTLGATRHPVIASGGVRSAQDLTALRDLTVGGRRLAGAIVGKALVEGMLSVEEALQACAASG